MGNGDTNPLIKCSPSIDEPRAAIPGTTQTPGVVGSVIKKIKTMHKGKEVSLGYVRPSLQKQM